MESNTKKKILVIDDESSLRETLKSNLEYEHFEVLEAKDGAEGLATALKEHPDLILLDIVMPKIDGMAMLANLRKDAWGNKAKIIVLTNFGDTERTAEMLELGVTDYLVKVDWKMADVITKVKEKLK